MSTESDYSDSEEVPFMTQLNHSKTKDKNSKEEEIYEIEGEVDSEGEIICALQEIHKIIENH